MKLKVQYRVYKRPPLVPNLRQMNPVRALPPYFPKNHSNYIFPLVSYLQVFRIITTTTTTTTTTTSQFHTRPILITFLHELLISLILTACSPPRSFRNVTNL